MKNVFSIAVIHLPVISNGIEQEMSENVVASNDRSHSFRNESVFDNSGNRHTFCLFVARARSMYTHSSGVTV